jgi:ABC-type spermidine/putrescine transport system permease subunit II
LVLLAIGWVIVTLVGSVLSVFWGSSDATFGSAPSEPLLEWLASLTVLVMSVPPIVCGVGLLVSVVVSLTRGGPYEEAPAA